VPAELLAQFPVAEDLTRALGLVTWPMVEMEADDALATAAARFAALPEVEQVVICSPDKDLTQCVRGDKVVCLDRRQRKLLDEPAVKAKFGVLPESMPDWLALVGDSADGYPGIPGIGKVGAARLVTRYGAIEGFPAETLGDKRELALLFKDLATLRRDEALFGDVEELRWQGPPDGFAAEAERLGDPRLAERASKAAPG